METQVKQRQAQRKSKGFTPPVFKLLIISWLCIIGFGSAYAQKPANFDSLSYTQQVDAMYQGIRKDSLKTGILIDRSKPIAGILEIQINDSIIDTVSEMRFKQIIWEFERASVNSNFLAGAKEKIRELEGRLKYTDTIPIGIIDVEYETLNPYVLDSGLVRFTLDSMLESTPNDFRNPFIKRRLTLAVVLDNRNTITRAGFLKIYPELIYSNTAFSFSSLEIELNAVTYQIDGIGIAIPFNKQDIGTNALATLNVKFTKPNAALVVKRSISNLNLLQLNNEILPCTDFPHVIQGIDFNRTQYTLIEPNIVNGIAHLFYYFGNNNNSNEPCSERPLKNVVLILDGFDPMDLRRQGKFYNELLLIKNTNENLGEKLRAKGFDVVFVNFPDLSNDQYATISTKRDHGAGYIEANGLALVRVIQNINTRLAANSNGQAITIIGPSMGGLISRYALAYMEDKRAQTNLDVWNHNCKLWISFDSPHLGANVPVAAQFAIKDATQEAGSDNAEVNWEKKIMSPAARQLLLFHIDAEARTGHSEDYFYVDPHNSIFYSNLRNNGTTGGFPKAENLRRIAVSNGSLSGENQRYPANQILQGGTDAVRFEARRSERDNNDPDDKLWGRIKFKYLNDQSTFAGTECYLQEERKLGQWFRNRRFFTWNDQKRRFYKFPASYIESLGTGSIDVTSGGFVDTFGDVAEAGHNTWSNSYFIWNTLQFGVRAFVELNNKIHNFIPLKSSLAFNAGIKNLNEDLSNRDLVCTNEIPFDDYYAGRWNTEHVSISQDMAEYVIDEIEGKYHKREVLNFDNSREICEGEIIDFNYTGLDFDIPGFRTDILFDGISSLPFKLTPVGTNSNPQFVVEFRSDPNNPGVHYSGPWNGTLNITITRFTASGVPCVTLIKENWHIGGPKMDAVDAVEFCINQSKSIALNHLPLFEQSFQISSSNPGCVGVNNLYTMTNPNTSIFYAKANPRNGCNCILTITATNDCGSTFETINATVLDNCAYADKFIKAMPLIGGPLTEQIEVQVVDAEGVLAGANVTVELLDSRGTVLKRKTTNANSTATFDATSLTVGRYVFSGKTSAGELLPKQNWFKQGLDPSVLLISPNPAIKGVDQELVGNLLGVDEKRGPFQIKIANTNESVLDSLKTNFLEFTFPITNLEEGLYLISAHTKKDSLIAQEYVTLGIKARPSLRITQNPVNDVLTGILENAVAGYKDLTLRVVSFQGNEVATGTGDAGGFELDVTHLIPGSYILTANDGKRVFSVQFQKN